MAETTMVPLQTDKLIAQLEELGVVTPEQIEQAKAELATTQERFSVILARLGVIRNPEIGKRIAPQLGAVPQRVEGLTSAPPAVAQVPLALWRTHRLVPLKEANGKWLVATDDPFSVFALDVLGQRCGCALEAVFVSEGDLTSLLSSFEKGTRPVPPSPSAQPPHRTPPAVADGTAAAAPTAPILVAKRPPQPAAPLPPVAAPVNIPSQVTATDEPIIRLVDSVLSEAVRMRASDVHIQPSRNELRVRYRVDGVLHDVNSPPLALQGPIVSRIKIIAGLNIAEKRLPQDGRLQLEAGGRPLDVRISTLPAMHGESVVMRILDRSQPLRGLKEMGLMPADQQTWESLIHRPHGMVLVTGPTGSGKTTTLYGALSLLNRADRKLITVEDPVEYQLAGVNQVAVRANVGLTFAAGLRSMLRQAPDVIMVGEIRDQETAQIAVQAALTGHLVLSTLHTNDAASAVTRLVDMGIAPFLVSSTLQGVLAQRLVRRICPSCRLTDDATVEERAFLGEPEVAQVIRGTGCDTCRNSGYFGRVGLFELLSVSDPLRQLIVDRASASAIKAHACREGMRDLRMDGCFKVREGLTTVAEVLRVVSSL